MIRKIRQPIATYSAPILWSVVVGTLLCVAFYCLVDYGPARLPLVKRYAECHAVAYATVELFFIALVALVYKGLEAQRQWSFLRQCESVVEDVKSARANESIADPIEQVSWLDAAWKAQSATIYNSWFGRRAREILKIQRRRQSIESKDEDLRLISERDADAQHDSYALVRIVTWAMPMLGFLGTVVGISDTLGQMDASALASGSQDAMNSLTAGLYVAFDTTAIGLVLTMAIIFVQFSVNKIELRLLTSIDSLSADLFGSCLFSRPTSVVQDTSKVDEILSSATEKLVASMELLVGRQASLWQDSLKVVENYWGNMTDRSSEHLQHSLQNAVGAVSQKLLNQLSEQQEKIALIHTEGAATVDSRLRDWQVTMSDQARAAVDLQRELIAQCQALRDLVESTTLIKSMEEPIQSTLHRLTDIDRFHEAAICLTEAVAVLGTQMERYGYLGRQPVRRKLPESTANETPIAEPRPTIPMARKAG